MNAQLVFEEIVDLLTDEEINRMERRAWITASGAWTRYQQSLWRGDPLETTNLLNELAWRAENFWRETYDASEARRRERNAAR